MNLIAAATLNLHIDDDNSTVASKPNRSDNQSVGSTSTKHSSRRLSMLSQKSSGDIFPSPYSIKDPRVLELMQKVNMDQYDEELSDLRRKTYKDIMWIIIILFLGTFCMGLVCTNFYNKSLNILIFRLKIGTLQTPYIGL